MNVLIEAALCPVVTRAVQPVVLHPRYLALGVTEVDAALGLFELLPLTSLGAARVAEDGEPMLLVSWVGDVMEQVRLDIADVLVDGRAA